MTGAKSTALKELVKALKTSGVPIDGVGIQSHLTVGGVPPTLQQNMAEFAALGVEVAITELDIRFATLPPSAAGLAQQRADYASVVGACSAVPGCVGVTVWDFADKVRVRPGMASLKGATSLGPEGSLLTSRTRRSTRGFRALLPVRVRLARGTRLVLVPTSTGQGPPFTRSSL